MKMIAKSIAWHVKEPEQNYLHVPCGNKSPQISTRGKAKDRYIFGEAALILPHTY